MSRRGRRSRDRFRARLHATGSDGPTRSMSRVEVAIGAAERTVACARREETGRRDGRSDGRPVGRCLASIDAGRTQRCISHRRIRGTGFVIPSRKAVSAAVPDHRSRRFTELPRAVRTARGARFGRSRTRPLIGRRVTRATTTPARYSTCSALRNERSVAQTAGSQPGAVEFHAEGSACRPCGFRSAGTFPLPSDA